MTNQTRNDSTFKVPFKILREFWPDFEGFSSLSASLSDAAVTAAAEKQLPINENKLQRGGDRTNIFVKAQKTRIVKRRNKISSILFNWSRFFRNPKFKRRRLMVSKEKLFMWSMLLNFFGSRKSRFPLWWNNKNRPF